MFVFVFVFFTYQAHNQVYLHKNRHTHFVLKGRAGRKDGCPGASPLL